MNDLKGMILPVMGRDERLDMFREISGIATGKLPGSLSVVVSACILLEMKNFPV